MISRFFWQLRQVFGGPFTAKSTQTLAYGRDHIDVVYAFDDCFAKFAFVSIASLIVNCSNKLKIHCIVDRVDMEAFKRISDFAANRKVELLFYPTNNQFRDWKISHHLKPSAYYRIMAPYILPAQKVIYLDCDTIVTCDISGLWEVDIDEAWLAGVLDKGAASSSLIPLERGEPYINSGVLVMNLVALRRNELLARSQEIVSAYYDQILWADQCLLNIFANGRKLIVEERWNVQLSKFPLGAAERYMDRYIGSGIIHASGTCKPWMRSSEKWLQDLWMQYAALIYEDTSALLSE